jgi:beta-lactamase regulating signal transducer with metallopeptidase domain
MLKFTVKTITIETTPSYIPITENYQHIPINTPIETPIWPEIIKILMILYAIGVAFFLIRLLIAYITTFRIIIQSERKKFYNYILAITQQSISPFSIFKWLVIPQKKINHPDFNHIVQHESIHSRQYHSVDLLLAEIMIAFQWFNPFVWMTKKAIIENHEYIVDKTLLNKGVDPRQYQYSLLNYAMDTGGQLAVANHFNSNLLKKRICMMNKNKSPRWHRLKNFLILTVVSIVVFTTVSFETKVIAQTKTIETIIFENNSDSAHKVLKVINPDSTQKTIVINDSIIITQDGDKSQNGVIWIHTKDSTGISNHKGEYIKIDRIGQPILVDNYEFQNFNSSDSSNVILGKFKHKPIIIIDGKKIDSDAIKDKQFNMERIEVINGERAIELYGEDGKNGVFIAETNKHKQQRDSILLLKHKTYYNYSSSSNQTPKQNHPQDTGKITIRQKIYTNSAPPLTIVDGKEMAPGGFKTINPEKISKIEVLKGESAEKLFGEKGKQGAIVITLKKADQNKEQTEINNSKSLIFLDGRKVTIEEYNKQLSNREKINNIQTYHKNGEVGSVIATSQSPKQDLSISVSPNPANEKALIIINDGKANKLSSKKKYKIEIYTVFGRKINEFKTSETNIEFPVSKLEKGLYIVSVTSPDGERQNTGEMVVKH